MSSQYLVCRDLTESGIIERHDNFHCTEISTPKTQSGFKGYVYVFCGYFPNHDKPLKKIGISNDPIRRYMEVCNRCPYPVFIDFIFHTPYPGTIEKHLHRQFKQHRLTNKHCKSGYTEWFINVPYGDILSEFLLVDSGKNEFRIGSAECKKINYAAYFQIAASLYVGRKLNYSSLIQSIQIEQESYEVPVLIASLDYLYPRDAVRDALITCLYVFDTEQEIAETELLINERIKESLSVKKDVADKIISMTKTINQKAQ